MLVALHIEPTPLSIVSEGRLESVVVSLWCTFPDGAVARQAIRNASPSFPILTFEQNPSFYTAAC